MASRTHLRRRGRHRARRPAGSVLAGLLLVMTMLAVPAAAASLTVRVTNLGTWVLPADITVPGCAYLFCDDYDDYAPGTDLDGQQSDGYTWEADPGTWIAGDGAVSTPEKQRYAIATVDVGQSDDLRIQASIEGISPMPNQSGPGITFLADDNEMLWVEYRRDQGQVVLSSYDPPPNVSSELASAPAGDHAALTLTVEITQPTITVEVNGQTVLSYQLTSAEQAAFGDNTSHGLYADRDKTSVFTDFRIEELSS